MDAPDPLDLEHVRAADPDGRLGEILDLGEHLRDGLWRVASADLAPQPTPGGLLVIGGDGLQAGGPAARAALTPGLAAPLTVWESMPPPPGLAVSTLFTSYGGDDPFVLEAFARLHHTRRVVLTTGGALARAAREAGVGVVPVPGGVPEPRLAVGYCLVTCLELARLGGIGGVEPGVVEAAAVHVVRLARAWGPDTGPDSPVKRLARRRAGAGRAAPSSGAGDRGRDWVPNPVEVGETPLEQVVTRLLLDHLLELYAQVLATPGA